MNIRETIREEQDRYLIFLKDCVVTRIYIDHAFGIQLWGDQLDFDIKIEIGFELHSQHTKMFCNPALKSTLEPALNLFELVVEHIFVYKKGCLELYFENEIQIFVPSDQSYEAWQISSSNGLLVVSLPGGSVAVWYPY